MPTLKEHAVDPYGRRQSDPEKKQNLIPQNPRLWNMLTQEAKSRFLKFPSLPASKWIHSEYVKRGGIFVKSTKEDTRHDKSGRKTQAGVKEEKVEKQLKRPTNVKKPAKKKR